MITQMVQPEGSLFSPIVIVAEAPGREESIQGKMFVGASGHLLRQTLAASGININDTYRTNVVKFRPEGGKFSSLYYKGNPTDVLQKSLTALDSELKRLCPRVIITLGEEALRAVTGRKGITNWRGSPLKTPYGLVVPCVHPAMILRKYQANRMIFGCDIRKALKYSQEGYNPRERVFDIKPTFASVMSFLKKDHKKIAFDIETVGRHVRCLGIATSSHYAMCIPFLAVNIAETNNSKITLPSGGPLKNYWTEEEEYKILQELNRIFYDPSIKKIAQNYSFDATVLGWDFGFHINNLYMDTLAAHHVLYAELPKSLNFLNSFYLDWPYYADHDTGNDTSEWTYNCLDCCTTFECSEAIEKELKEEPDLWEFYKNHVENTLIALARAQNRGLRIDLKEREKRAKEYKGKLEEIQKDIDTFAGHPVNPNSSKQVKDFLYKEKRCHPATNKKGVVSSDETALKKVRKLYPSMGKFISNILRYRNIRKLLSSFLEVDLKEDILETTFNVSGTVSGRLSSSSTIWDTGINAQNIEKSDLRRLIIPRDEDIIIKADLSQAEARYVGWDAKIDSMIQGFLTPGWDVYKWNASENTYHIPYDAVTPEQRKRAKIGVLAGNYDMSAPTAAGIYSIPKREAEVVLKAYQNQPEIQAWWKRIEEEVVRTRTLYTSLGRKRIFTDRLEKPLFRSAYSARPQGTVGDIINRAFHILDALFPEDDPIVYGFLNVHDEIVFSGRASKKDEYLPIIKRVMEYPIDFPGIDSPLKIPVDIETGPNWWDVKKCEVKDA